MKKLQKWLPGLLIFAVLLASLAGGAAYGKYIFNKNFNGTVTIQANLGSITVLEHTATRMIDGSYKLLDSTTNKNSYIIIPGLDIPKDPYVVVNKTSSIPVYVFIEVTDTIQPADKSVITYQVDTKNWKELNGVAGKNGGKVYVYATGDMAQQVISSIGTIQILDQNKVFVHQDLKQVTSNVSINFYACMRQVVTGQTPAEIYISTNY